MESNIQTRHRGPSLSSLLFALILLAFMTPVLSDVSVSKPLAGQTFSASDGSVSVPITWIDNNALPKLADITSYTFVLCTGPNDLIHALPVSVKVAADDITGHTYTLDIDADTGADGQYYIQVFATAKTGWTIHYSNRFNLTDMTGTYVPTVGVITTPPEAQTSVAGTNTGTQSINSASFSIYYTSQTGPTRFAPMQSQPGSTIKDRSSWSRRYPTSAVTYYTSYSTSLAHASTITPGWSYTISSAANWASPAPYPSVLGYYAASERLTRTPTLYTPTFGNPVTKTT